MEKVFVTQSTEYEAGWGQRPDGYFISTSRDELEKYIAKDGNSGCYDLFWRCGEIDEMFVNETEAFTHLKKAMVARGRKKGGFKITWIKSLKETEGLEFFKKA
jgi:hypothetical protein